MKLLNSGTGDKIKDRYDEDLEVLQDIDNIFKKKRGFIVKMPKANTPVIVSLSGGLDSVSNVGVLLDKFKLQVYPFFINREQTSYKWERKSVDWYDNFFSEKYPNLYHKVIEIKLTTPGMAYKNMLRKTKMLKDNPKLRETVSYPARNPIIFLTGMEYGYSLQSKGIFPKTFFTSLPSTDTLYHSTLTSIRLMNLLMCQITNDYDWQFISIPIEREFDNCYKKDRFVRYCSEHGIPLEHTRSCCVSDEIQCGTCWLACWDRRMAFKDAGVEDKTKYQHPMPKSYKETTRENYDFKK